MYTNICCINKFQLEPLKKTFAHSGKSRYFLYPNELGLGSVKGVHFFTFFEKS